MEKVIDWSRLVTINYTGGFGGDFFNKLLNLAVNGVDNVNDQKTEYNQYSELIGCFEVNKKNIIKSFSSLAHNNYEVNNFDHLRAITYKQELTSIKQQCYHPDRDQYIKNLQQKLSNIYKPSGQKLDLVNIHNTTTKKDILHSWEVFPGSKNIGLICDNEDQYIIFRILLMYKLHLNKIFISNDNQIHYIRNYQSPSSVIVLEHSIDVFLENEIDHLNKTMFDYNEFHINSYDLLLEGRCYDGSLSDYLNTEIILDKSYISVWQKEAYDILNQIGITTTTNLTVEHVRSLLKDFLIQTRPKLSDKFNEWKFYTV